MCPTIVQQQTRLLKISWISLLASGIGILGFGILGIMITLEAFRRKEKWAWFTLWYYPIFWTIHLVGELPPGNDHIHQIVFIVISLLGLLLPVRQLFSRNMVKS